MNDDTEGCPGTNRHGEPCGHPAGWGTDRDEGPCKFHGGAADNRGENNGNYEHGGYSKYLSEDMTEAELERADAIFEDLQDPESAQDVARAAVVDLWVRWDRTKDPRYMTEIRQVCDTFGLVLEDVLQVQHSGTVEHEHTHELDDRQRAHLDALTEGTVEIEVEAVDDAGQP